MRVVGATNMTLMEDLETEVMVEFLRRAALVRPKLAERMAEVMDHFDVLTSDEGLAFGAFTPEECGFLLRTLENLLNGVGESA
jgi:hypothetical protein